MAVTEPPAPAPSSEPPEDDLEIVVTPRLRLRGFWARAGILAAVLVVLGALASQLNLRPDLRRVRVTVLSGPPEGHYHALVAGLATLAARQGGRITNAATEGSRENLTRLAAAGRRCDVQFGLAQAGSELPPGRPLHLVGRLAKAESVFFFGRNADAVTEFAHLKGLRIGIGPERSGTAQLARTILGGADLAPLGPRLSHHTVPEQLDLAARGELDLAVVVMDEDAPLVVEAVRDRGLQIAGFPHLDVVARKHKWLRHGRIGAGQYDPVRMLPPTDKRVLRVDTLVMGNGCASRSQTMGLLTVLAEELPDFMHHNKTTPNATRLPLAAAARSFFDKEGPDWLDEHVPWLVDIMPTANWVYLVMAASMLLNAMTLAHRFRLWRIDVARVKLEAELMRLFGATTTIDDIPGMGPEPALRTEAVRDGTAHVVRALERLAARCRRQSVSMLVPMGQEMAYRYQEGVIHKSLAILRDFRRRCL
ncbi:MAG TPA: TAXI family TRAP transporter solute-binding subunit [Polyangia bacterium]|jgi:TRAP-type uncharacterized transport system substrate-binding protein